MAEKRSLRYFLLRYVPNAVRGEFVNFGLVMIEDSEMPGRFANARFPEGLSKLRCFDPQADLEMLRALGQEITHQVVETRDLDGIRRKLNEFYSNLVQLSETSGCMSDDPTREIEKMAGVYFGRINKNSNHENSKRNKIHDRMRGEFEIAGAWPLMDKKIAAANYGQKGDPLKVDCGYANGKYKMFHALAVDSDPSSVKELMFSFPRLAAGVEEKRSCGLELKPIVDDNLDSSMENVQFAYDTFDQYGIVPATLSELPALAMQAKRDLSA